MVRLGCIALGGALAALWALGLWADRSATILWFDAVFALLAFSVAALEREDELGASRGGAPALLALGLGIVAIVGLAAGQPRWAVWANFLAAFGALAIAIAGASSGREAYAHARGRPRRRTLFRR